MILYFSVSRTVNDGFVTFELILIIGIFLYLHSKYYGNKCEAVLLFCLVLVIVCQSLSSLSDYMKEYILSFFILFPMILLVYYLYTFMTKKKNNFVLKQRIKYLILAVIAYYTKDNHQNRNIIDKEDSLNDILGNDIDSKMSIKLKKLSINTVHTDYQTFDDRD